jgi:hypothetical protein
MPRPLDAPRIAPTFLPVSVVGPLGEQSMLRRAVTGISRSGEGSVPAGAIQPSAVNT